jgi:hypothetical protein
VRLVVANDEDGAKRLIDDGQASTGVVKDSAAGEKIGPLLSGFAPYLMFVAVISPFARRAQARPCDHCTPSKARRGHGLARPQSPPADERGTSAVRLTQILLVARKLGSLGPAHAGQSDCSLPKRGRALASDIPKGGLVSRATDAGITYADRPMGAGVPCSRGRRIARLRACGPGFGLNLRLPGLQGRC